MLTLKELTISSSALSTLNVRLLDQAEHSLLALENMAKKSEKDITKKDQQISGLKKKKTLLLESKIATIKQFLG